MNLSEASVVLRRLEGIWPQQQVLNGSREEWLEFLLALDYDATVAALAVLRDVLKWRPSMSELKGAYLRQAQVMEEHQPFDEARRLLPGATEADPRKRYTLFDAYGASTDRWIYCWSCAMAISLEEQATTAVYLRGLGLRHARCPKPGTAPAMPVADRNERESYWQRNGVRFPERRTA